MPGKRILATKEPTEDPQPMLSQFRVGFKVKGLVDRVSIYLRLPCFDALH